MARITVEDCIDKFESRFELVLVASNRARKLHSGESPTVEKDNDKNTVIALREIADETIPIEDLKNKLVEEYQTVSSQDEDEDELSIDYADPEKEEVTLSNQTDSTINSIDTDSDIASDESILDNENNSDIASDESILDNENNSDTDTNQVIKNDPTIEEIKGDSI